MQPRHSPLSIIGRGVDGCHRNLPESGIVAFQEFIKSVEAGATRARLWAWVIGAVVVIPSVVTAAMGYFGGSFGQAPLFQLIPAVLITAVSSLWLAIRFMPTGTASKTFAGSGGEPLATSTDRTLIPLDIWLETTDDPKIHFKKKLRIILRNASGKHITIRAATWERRSSADVPVRQMERYLWQIEGDNGWENGSWRPQEVAEILVPTGAVLRTWIGLNDGAGHDGIRRRLVQGHLGILIGPLTIDGQVTQQRLALGPISVGL
jgi:hypothetical protein